MKEYKKKFETWNLRNQTKIIAIDSREVAPLKAHEKMFVNNSKASEEGR